MKLENLHFQCDTYWFLFILWKLIRFSDAILFQFGFLSKYHLTSNTKRTFVLRAQKVNGKKLGPSFLFYCLLSGLKVIKILFS